MKNETINETNEVIRPALPILLLPIAALWAGLFFAQTAVWNSAEPLLMCLFIPLSIAIIIGGRCNKRYPQVTQAIVMSLLALIAGVVLGLLHWSTMSDAKEHVKQLVEQNSNKAFAFIVEEDPSKGAISAVSLATISLDNNMRARVRILWGQDQEPLSLGAKFTAKVRFKPLTSHQEFLHQKGVIGSVTLESIQPYRGVNTLQDAIYTFRNKNISLLSRFDTDGSALLKGVLLGETSQLDNSEAGRAYKTSGLSHLVAVSGGHLVIIAALLMYLLRKLALKRWLEITIITLFLVAFVVLTGLQPSAIRATVMVFISSIGPLLGRRTHIPSALSAAAIVMLALQPPTAFSIGFWLSVFAVFGLTIFCPLIFGYLALALPKKLTDHKKLANLFKSGFINPLAMTITAQLATVSITAPIFATLSLISPLANVLVTPFITVLVAVGVVLLCIMPLLGTLADPLIFALCTVADVSVYIAGWCASLPYACLPMALELAPSILVMLIIATVFYVAWPKPSRIKLKVISMITCMAVIFMISTVYFPMRPQVIMLNVGQGDSILIRENSTNVLVDTGKSDSALLEALARQRVLKIDAIIVTHLDEDHCGALGALIGTIPIGNVYFAEGLNDSRGDEEVFNVAEQLIGKATGQLSCGDSIKIGKHISLKMLWPQKAISEGGNNESICLELLYDHEKDGVSDTSMLLTGDLEHRELEVIQKTMPDAKYDILKVGHHGSRNSLSDFLVREMECKIALIGVGENNSYGHPAADTLDVLDDLNVRIFRTDQNGNITLHFQKNDLQVYCDNITD